MENETAHPNIILILRPQPFWGIVGAELKRVAALGRFMQVERTLRSEEVKPMFTPLLTSLATEQLQRVATLCQELLPDSLCARYANKKMTTPYVSTPNVWPTAG